MGNFSRDTFDRLKHYVGVRLQQGVPLVDADWNELEDIRKYELRAYLKWYVGDGVPVGSDAFLVSTIGAETNNFLITGGDGTAEGIGRCLVDGWDVMTNADVAYTAQALFNNTDLSTAWEVDPLAALTEPVGTRNDVVYLDVWEREVNADEDNDIINPVIGIETSVRLKREWVVRVAENATEPPVAPANHSFYVIATLIRDGATISVDDERELGINIVDLKSQFEQHLSTTNPHNVTPAQIGALALGDYGFRERISSSITFTQNDADRAVRTITTGFATKYVWVVGYCNTNMEGRTFGGHVSSYADLTNGFIQRGISSEIFRYTTEPFWKQNTGVVNGLAEVRFRNEVASPIQDETIGLTISSTTDTEITFRLSRDVFGSSTTGGGGGTGTGGGGTGTAPASIVGLPSFQTRFYILCFG